MPNFPPADHPFWKLAHTVVASLCVTFVFTVCAFATANSFDSNEIQMLASGGAIVGIGKHLVEKFFWKG